MHLLSTFSCTMAGAARSASCPYRQRAPMWHLPRFIHSKQGFRWRWSASDWPTNWSATLSRELLESLNNAGRLDNYWIVGDIAYADDAFTHVGDLLKFDYEDVYDGFVEWNQNISSSKPLMVSAG